MNYETYLQIIFLGCLVLAGLGFLWNGWADRKRKGFGKIFSTILGLIILLSSILIALFVYRGQIFSELT
jgi:hypothetical protein